MTGTEPRVWVLELPYWTPPLTLNARQHHQARARAVRDIKINVRWLVRAQQIPRLDRIHVALTYTPERRITRDADNLVGTLKPAIDGLRDYPPRRRHGRVVDSGHVGIVADDSPIYVTWSPPVITDPGPGHRTGRLWLTIREDTAP